MTRHSPNSRRALIVEDEYLIAHDLEETMREAVHFGFPYREQPFAELLILVVAAPDTKLEEQCEALAKSVEAE